ncbi:MAG: hypothetical protein PF448_04195 [Bacteroidales bacterium]|jgi:outer membrane protein OmpA-like peptidoglycan-associated protein|nr:hypothetical protein [Bacteroidales bacterium]
MRKSFYFLLLCLMSVTLTAQDKEIGEFQNSDEKINPDAFDRELLNQLVLKEVNMFMDSVGLEGFIDSKFLTKIAEDHAAEMAVNSSASTEGKGKTKDVRSRIQYYGGSGIGDELVMRFSIKTTEAYYTYEELARNIVLKWSSSVRTVRKLNREEFYQAGVGSALDDSKKKVYVSFFMGNYYTQNAGAYRIDEMTVPYTTKKYGLNPWDYAPCRKTKRYFPDIVDLQDGLSINQNGEIIFKFNDLRHFKRLIRSKKDGLAVDIVQKSQYKNCKAANIVDYERVNRGIMTKRMWSKKIYKKNIAPAEGKRQRVTKLEVILGELPEELNPEDVELNLMIIQNKHVCHNIPPSFKIDAGYEYSQKIDLMPDTIVPEGVPAYKPEATTNKFSFRIPFERNKYDYKMEDIQPVVNTLNEPDFIINKVHVAAYSSLEGNVKANEKLQKQRAQSIVNALKRNQNESLIDSVSAQANWDDFKKDVMSTVYEKMAAMTKEEAIQHIQSKGLAKKLEPILKNHRYADVTVWVTYDIDGDKEEMYVLDQFNKAIKAGDLAQALSIQKYMLEQVAQGNYEKQSVDGMEIPEGADYAGLNMNKICMQKMTYNDIIDEDYQENINELWKLDEKNPYIYFNKLYCGVLLNDVTDEYVREDLQAEVDYLYDFELPKKQIDLLNIEMQYHLMDEFKDSVGYDHPIVVESLERIKDIIIFDEVNWQNSLKLASVFLNHGDYDYAFSLLNPFIKEDNVFPELLFTYISLCSKVDFKYHSNKFVLAMEKARETDPDRFCDLFKGKEAFPRQVFANDKIKQMYCETCK